MIRPIPLSLLLALPAALAGQVGATLEGVRTLRCTFTHTVGANMNGDTPIVPPAHASKDELVFDQIDWAKNTARLIGNQGAADVRVVLGDNGLALLELTPSGVVQVTAVYSKKTAAGAFKAVASRHTGAFGNPIPSQAYGSCRALQ